MQIHISFAKAIFIPEDDRIKTEYEGQKFIFRSFDNQWTAHLMILMMEWVMHSPQASQIPGRNKYEVCYCFHYGHAIVVAPSRNVFRMWFDEKTGSLMGRNIVGF